MTDAFTDVAKMKKIKEEIKAHEGQVVEMTLENGRKRQKNRLGKLIEVYPSLFIVEFGNVEGDKQANVYVESFTYSDILTEKNLIWIKDNHESEKISHFFYFLSNDIDEVNLKNLII